MRDASDPPVCQGFICESCLRFFTTGVEGLFSNPRVGSPQRFCTPACRQAAYRRRRAGVPDGTPLQRRGGRGRSLKAQKEVVTSPDK